MPYVQCVETCWNPQIVEWVAPNAETLRDENWLLIMEKIQVVREKKMEIKVLKQTDNELKLEIHGEGHSLLNLLQKALLEDDNIEMAGYDVPHPLFDRGILYVQTKDKQSPEGVVKEAVKKVHGLNKDFHKSFKKASKAYKVK